jgi:thiamine-monophosphate kinase
LRRNLPSSTMRDVGERVVVQRILRILRSCPKQALPIGDDAAAISIDDGKALVVKADMLVGATDVPPGMTASQIGRKVVTMNFSDLAAKGVQPEGVLISLGVPRNYVVDDVLSIMRGVSAEARKSGAYVMGGDTGESSDLVVSGMAFGFTEVSNLVKRSGASVGDVLAVTGQFGMTGAGLKILLEGKGADTQLRRRLLRAVYEPRARVLEGVALGKSKCLSSSIDSSDGLAWAIHELARSSKVGFRVEEIPMPREVEKFAQTNKLDRLDLALYGGEEYELVVTVKPDLWGKAQETTKRVGGALYRIGEATKEHRVILEGSNGEVRAIEPKGYEHFR